MASRSADDERHLSAAGFERLLARLDPNRDRAAAEYERLRLALEKFFDWQGAWPPEECADETLDRLTRKLETDLAILDVRRYAHGIARLVLLEWRRRPVAASIDEGPEVATPPLVPPRDDEDRLHECFDRCLSTLSDDSRSLVLDYYVAERRTKIDNRRRLAQTFAISEAALRSRVQRVRDRLETCVHECTAASRGGGR